MRLHIFSILVLFFSLQLTAQEKVLFHGGAYAGISTSQLSGDQLSGFHKVGIYAGAFVNVNFTPKSLLQLEISFIQKGSRSVSKFSGLIYHVNLQYFEIPFLYKWQFSKRFSLETGPSIGYLIKNSNIERDAYGNGSYVNNPSFNRIDLCALGGFNVEIAKHFKVNIRYSQSVLPIRKHAGGAVYRLNRGQYNSVLMFTFVTEF